jgi:hypothetical protein
MNNSDVQRLIDSCQADIDQVNKIIIGLGLSSNIVPYLTRYAIIRACGTIETAFKSIIADYCSYRSKKQVKAFLDSQVRENSANPTYDNICKLLKYFDTDWNNDFKNQINAHPRKYHMKTSLQSLVNVRNQFAHGGNPTISISDLIQYFLDSKDVIKILDRVVC